jgi:hypothetical protein
MAWTLRPRSSVGEQHRAIEYERLRTRLEAWEDKVRKLFALPPSTPTRRAREVRAQLVQELVDRRETVRLKLERLRRARGPLYDAAREELERAFRELERAWKRGSTILGRLVRLRAT